MIKKILKQIDYFIDDSLEDNKGCVYGCSIILGTCLLIIVLDSFLNPRNIHIINTTSVSIVFALFCVLAIYLRKKYKK